MLRPKHSSGRDGSPNRPRTPQGGVPANACPANGLICVAAVLFLLAGCARPAAQPDASGLRLVSTAPNLTEIVCALGAADLLAGRTESCDFPPEVVPRVPVTGGFGTPYLEPLLATRPTHVLETVLADPEFARRLQSLRIPVVHVPCTRLDEIPPAILQLGSLTGRTAEAQRLAGSVREGIDRARAESAALTRPPRVLLLFAPDTPITAGRNAFVSELLELAGGANVADALLTDYYHVSLEWLITQNPDILLCLFETHAREPYELFARQTGWNALSAVRQRRVYTVSDLSAVSRPGPRVLEGIAQLKQILLLDSSRLESARIDSSRSPAK
jgi:iron complex transport system substrate-binding protein